jgi:hypothetical protein
MHVLMIRLPLCMCSHMYAALAIMLAQPAFQGTLMIMLLQGAG